MGVPRIIGKETLFHERLCESLDERYLFSYTLIMHKIMFLESANYENVCYG